MRARGWTLRKKEKNKNNSRYSKAGWPKQTQAGTINYESMTPVAGPIFETKNRAIFLERFFGRGITAREQLSRAAFSGNKSCSILSHPVMSRYGSRAVVAHSGGKLLPERVRFLETKEHPQISNASFWKRGRENVFLQMF